MKKSLILKIIFIVETCLVVLFALGNVFNFFKLTPVFNLIYFLGEQLFVFGSIISNLFHINIVVKEISYTSFNSLIGLIITNILFVILYHIIWTLVSYIVRKHNEDKLRSVVEKYELTKAEKARFRVRNYIHTFSPYVFISLIIPIIFLTVLVTARFDETICKEASSHLRGTLHFYSSYLEPALNSLFKEGDFHSIILSFFTRSSNNGYIDIMNVWFKDFAWFEYVFIVFICIFILFFWFIIFQALHLLVRKPIAKMKSKNACKAYIYKKEHQEYKIRKEYKNEVSSKSDEFIRKLEEDVNSHADSIASIGTEEDDEILLNPKSYEKNRKAYLEDIGYGVSDLGVSEKDIERAKPIVEREVRYISDEDIDIILEEEPVIEIIEEEVDTPIENDDNDEFYEKYLPDEVYESDDKPLSEDVRDFIYENIKEDELVSEDSLEEDYFESDDLNALEGNLPSEETTNEEVSDVEDITEESSDIESDGSNVDLDTKEPLETIEEEPTDISVIEDVEEDNSNIDLDSEEEQADTLEEPSKDETLETKEEENTPIEDDEKEETIDLDASSEEENSNLDVEIKEDSLEEQDETIEETHNEEILETIEEVPYEVVQEEQILVVNEEENVNIETSEEAQEVPELDILETTEVTHKKKKYNPFLKYTNTRTKGYGAKKVPTFKELSERKK